MHYSGRERDIKNIPEWGGEGMKEDVRKGKEGRREEGSGLLIMRN